MGENLMRLSGLLALWLLVGLSVDAARANTWCSARGPDKVFCEDFDRYCQAPPPYPQQCSSGSSPSIASLRKTWPKPVCGTELWIEETYFLSQPFAGRYPCQGDAQLGTQTTSMVPHIRERFGPNSDLVLATDEHPLILEFVLDGQTGGKIHHANTYLALSSGVGTVPTDHTLSENCLTACGGPDMQHPIVCQQENPPATCPPMATAEHRDIIAIGVVAYLDTNPCHCGSTPNVPTTDHPAVFDGFKWWTLRKGLFPGGGSGGAVPGDFRLNNRRHHIRLTIQSATMRIEMTAENPEPDEYSWCEMPRDFTGPFDRIFVGYAMACELEATEWKCAGNTKCIRGAYGAGAPCYDNILVRGGWGTGDPGACCLSDPACLELPEWDCLQIGGIYHGPNTDCATTVCCPTPPADHDVDGDVDLEDFGHFQACLTGLAVPLTDMACWCVDLDGDGDVDRDDQAAFRSAMTGAGIPAGVPD